MAIVSVPVILNLTKLEKKVLKSVVIEEASLRMVDGYLPDDEDDALVSLLNKLKEAAK